MVVDESGQVLFDQRSGPANLSTTPWHLIEANLAAALEGAPKPHAVCACVAGLLTKEQSEKAAAILIALTKCERVQARPDFHAAWEAAKAQGDVLVIAGTGVLICSEEYGAIVKSGGGGVLFGDHGSAASVGRNALARLIVSAPGAESDEHTRPTPTFLNAVSRLLGTLDPQEALAKIYDADAPAMIFASLAKQVGEDAEAGKEYALKATDDALARLAQDLRWHIGTYLSKKESGSVVLAGGLWKLSPYFSNRFHALLSMNEWKLKLIAQSPVHGACTLARKMK